MRNSAKRLLHIWLAYLLCIPGSPVMAQQGVAPAAPATPECNSSLWEAPASQVSPQRAWDNDTASLVGYRSKGKDNLESQYVTGDILRINADSFPSEVRSIAQSQSGVASLTFDAREIVIDMPLVFTSASVRFLAETVRFTQRGSITFTGEPRDGGDGVTIVADNIDSSDSLLHPFEFVTQSTSWPASAKRSITVNTRTTKPARPAATMKKWLRGLTLDEDYADLPKEIDPYQSYVVVSGTVGQTSYLKSLDTEMLWPQQLADKIAREFAESPFDADRNTFLRNKATRYLQLLKSTHNDLARSVLDSVKTAIDLHVDQLGFHRYYVPRTGFAEFQGAFKKLAEAQLSAMEAWNSAILAAHGGRQFDQNRFDELSANLQSADADVDTPATTVSTELGNLSQHEQDIAAALQKIDQQRVIIQARRDDAVQKDETKKNLAVATHVLVMASAFLPVSAPVAIGIGAAVGTTGNAVLSHNQGQTVTGLSVAMTLPAAISEAKYFNTLASTVKKDWDNARTSVKSLKDAQDGIGKAQGDDAKAKATSARNDAADKAGTALGKFGDSVSALFNKVKPPEATQLTLDSVEQSDTVLQDLLKGVGEIRNAEAETLARLDAARKDVILKTAKRNGLRTSVEAAPVTTLRNDREVSRLEELAWTIRQTFLRDLAYNVAVLLRAYKYHTTIDPTGPINPTYFSTYYRLSRPSQVSSEGREGEQFFYGGTEKELGDQLKSQDAQLRKEVEALETQVMQGYQKYLELIAQHDFLTEDKTLTCTNAEAVLTDEKCAFVKALNLEIERQVTRVAAGQTNVRPTSILIPMFIQQAYTGLPDKLLDASIAVKMEDVAAVKGKSIQFSLVHPFTGSLRVNSACYTVDMRRTDAIENVQRFTTSCSDTLDCTHTPVMLKEEYVRENAAFTALPLDAKYYLEVRVRDATDAQQFPRLTEMRIHFSYVQ